ncbi:ferredoxin [Streptomyces sp. NPDC126503]|uniref:ferredoxin n=1 Tax=Streptomyces sp. NPDC126503 TaxID=3155315 RepID=UPI0033249B81
MDTPAPVRVDRERCVGSGMCALTAPTVFDQDDDEGLVLLLTPPPHAGTVPGRPPRRRPLPRLGHHLHAARRPTPAIDRLTPDRLRPGNPTPIPRRPELPGPAKKDPPEGGSSILRPRQDSNLRPSA